jgi:elongation factor G
VLANVGRPQVAYREAISKPAQGEGRYIRQTGGKGQYGHVIVDFEPLERGTGFEYEWGIRGDRLSREWSKAVQSGIKEAMENGVIAGYPVVDLKATVVDGSAHDVDSSDMAFKIAGSMALKAAVVKAAPVIVEPIMKVEVVVPEDFMGDVIGDLNSRRGKVVGMDTKGHNQVIKSKVPMSEVLKYAPDLRSITSGRGEFHMEFSHYEEVPPHIAEKVIKEAKARQSGEQTGEKQ